jgi:hypothetical protein
MYCTLRYKLSNQKTKPFSLCLPGGKFFVFIKDGRESCQEALKDINVRYEKSFLDSIFNPMI